MSITRYIQVLFLLKIFNESPKQNFWNHHYYFSIYYISIIIYLFKKLIIKKIWWIFFFLWSAFDLLFIHIKESRTCFTSRAPCPATPGIGVLFATKYWSLKFKALIRVSNIIVHIIIVYPLKVFALSFPITSQIP